MFRILMAFNGMKMKRMALHEVKRHTLHEDHLMCLLKLSL
jgi:hypothetical protein